MVKFKKKYIKLTSTFLLLIMISVYCNFFFSQASTSTSGENYKEFDNKAPIFLQHRIGIKLLGLMLQMGDIMLHWIPQITYMLWVIWIMEREIKIYV